MLHRANAVCVGDDDAPFVGSDGAVDSRGWTSRHGRVVDPCGDERRRGIDHTIEDQLPAVTCEAATVCDHDVEGDVDQSAICVQRELAVCDVSPENDIGDGQCVERQSVLVNAKGPGHADAKAVGRPASRRTLDQPPAGTHDLRVRNRTRAIGVVTLDATAGASRRRRLHFDHGRGAEGRDRHRGT